VWVVLIVAFAGSSLAGDIKGKVAVRGLRSAENIIVYVDAIPGKAFPAPAQHVLVDQKKGCLPLSCTAHACSPIFSFPRMAGQSVK
jgi:hypothetical protein